MGSILERLPGLIQGRRWSRRIPWRIHQVMDRMAASGLYSRKVQPLHPSRTADAPVTLLFGGDLALHRWSVEDSARETFREVKPEFATADLSVLNLESVLSDWQKRSGEIGAFLRGSPDAVAALRYLGVHVVSSANNHALDFGSRGLLECGEIVRRNGIQWFGVTEDQSSGVVPGGLVRTVRGLKVGMMAATDHFGGVPEPGFPAPVWFDRSRMEKAVLRLREACDVVAVQLHWGYEFVTYPLLWHRDFARRLVDLGADIVCCHHAHVVMGVERWGRGVIAHGLGNFYFGRGGRNHPLGSFGLLLKVAVDRRGLASARVRTVRTDSSGKVRLEDHPPPGFHRLCDGLNHGKFLMRVEDSRVRYEVAQAVSGLANLARGRDHRGLMERQAFLKAPRQEWLIQVAEGSEDPKMRLAGGFLREVSSLPESLLRTFPTAAGQEMEGLSRWCDPRGLTGRLP